MAIHPALEEKGFTPFHAAQMVEKARWAAEAFSTYGGEETLKIAEAVANAGHAEARRYAKWAVEETGFGVVEHKIIKNEACSKGIFDRYRQENLTGVRENPAEKLLEIARPAGVVFALTPSTNPIATLYYKVLIALMGKLAKVLDYGFAWDEPIAPATRAQDNPAIPSGYTYLLQFIALNNAW